jgi:hypothetical protein
MRSARFAEIEIIDRIHARLDSRHAGSSLCSEGETRNASNGFFFHGRTTARPICDSALLVKMRIAC